MYADSPADKRHSRLGLLSPDQADVFCSMLSGQPVMSLRRSVRLFGRPHSPAPSAKRPVGTPVVHTDDFSISDSDVSGGEDEDREPREETRAARPSTAQKRKWNA